MTIGRFTDDLLLSAGEKWDRVVNHRFTKELAAGTIDRKGSTYQRLLIAIYA